MNQKRLFFGMRVAAPWPAFPEGRLLAESVRHMTLAFLGACEYEALLPLLPTFPQPPFKVGLVGQFDQCLFLPRRHPRVIAWHPAFAAKQERLLTYQKEIIAWLHQHSLPTDSKRDFLPHVSLARSPFDAHAWEKAFHPLPFQATHIHLYESLGHSTYTSLWHLPLLVPIEEIEHTADLAFCIRGETHQDLYLHACHALAFHFPPILPFFPKQKPTDLPTIIAALNTGIAVADGQIGVPFKAVSHHGEIKKEETLHWEMIVDV